MTTRSLRTIVYSRGIIPRIGSHYRQDVVYLALDDLGRIPRQALLLSLVSSWHGSFLRRRRRRVSPMRGGEDYAPPRFLVGTTTTRTILDAAL